MFLNICNLANFIIECFHHFSIMVGMPYSLPTICIHVTEYSFSIDIIIYKKILLVGFIR